MNKNVQQNNDSVLSSARTQITVYRPNQRHELGFLETWVVMARNVWKVRELVWQLFKRDFIAAYKKSFVSFAWVFITPLVGIVQWVFLKNTGMFIPGHTEIPYVPYVLVGTTMWGLFMGFYRSASVTLTSGAEFIMQVSYPHEALFFQQTAQMLANFVIGFAASLIVLFVYHVTPSIGILSLPLVVLPLFFIGAAIGLIAAMIAVVAVDISRILNMVLGVMLFSVPVIYDMEGKSLFVQAINKWNPLTYLVCSCRDIVFFGRLYHPVEYFICAVISLIIFLISWRLFYVSEHKIIERMI